MTSPSQKLKRAWTQAGKPLSLKKFARLTRNPGANTHTSDHAAYAWLKRKGAQGCPSGPTKITRESTGTHVSVVSQLGARIAANGGN